MATFHGMGSSDNRCIETQAVCLHEVPQKTAIPRSSPKRKQRPASGTVPPDLTTLSASFPIEKKRSNKRALLPLAPQHEGEVIEAEGLLDVVEEVEQRQTRTLGSVRPLPAI